MYLSLFLLLPALSTCTAVGSNNGFDISLGQNSVLFIDANTSSCAGVNAGVLDNSVTATYFQLNNMTVTWTNTQDPLTIQWIEFKSTDGNINSGSPFACMIGGTDLMNAWVQGWDVLDAGGFPICGATVTVPQSVTITSTSPAKIACDIVALTNYCPFKCGGITMTNIHQTSSGAINLEVYATYDSGGGNLIPLVLYKSLTYFYQGI